VRPADDRAVWEGVPLMTRWRVDIIRKRAARAVVRRTERVPVILAADELALLRNFDFRLECRADRLRFENF
jgi:hypothetical protein